MATEKSYPLLIGKIIVNLSSLEVSLRFYLLKREGKETGFKDPDNLNVGDKVALNSFTDYRQLRALIRDYNAYQNNANDKLDEDKIVKIRDLLAHGRPMTKTIFPLTSVKFSKPTKNASEVEVTEKEILDVDWLESSITFIFKSIAKIHQM